VHHKKWPDERAKHCKPGTNINDIDGNETKQVNATSLDG
jgi:hypothetical protein